MSNESSSSSSSGIGFGGLLTVAFIVLKLCGISEVATWSWWWVLSPLWIGLLVFLVIFAAMAFIAIVAGREGS